MIEKEFKGWFDYNDEEIDSIYDTAIISFDTNILLSLFKFSNSTTSAMINSFKAIKDKMVLSYYVMEEFTRNRKKVISDNMVEYDKFINNVESKYSDLINEINKISEKRLPEKKSLVKSVENNQEKVINSINKEKELKQKVYKDREIEKCILDLFNEKIINKYNASDFEKIREEGIKRQKESIPPGYMDIEKNENGDYHIFKSLIDYCKKNKKHLIFVTDDTKEDWFRKLHGIFEPREELLNEFYRETGNLILILTLSQFLSNDKIITNKIDSGVLEEVKISSKSYEIDNYKYQIRVKKIFKKLLKYKSKNAILKNLEEITLSLRTLKRIGYGVNDEKLINEIELLEGSIITKNYSSYLSLISSIENKIIKEKDELFLQIFNLINYLKHQYSDGVAISLLNLFIDYFKQFSTNTMEEKIALLKSRELLKKCNEGDIEEYVVLTEIMNIYNIIEFNDAKIGIET